ncbi:MAG TPA: hypothetical protein VNZ86_12710, partial [Bacteroidia bacterium]|nr:hypothetical protein [Bacteroidia bacterium]
MIIYDKGRISGMLLREQARGWHRKGDITDAELENIQTVSAQAYTTPKLLLRIGYFIFGMFILSAALGLLFLFMLPGGFHTTTISTLLLIYATGVYLVADWMVREKAMYRSGITHALLFMSGLCLWAGLAFWIETKTWPAFMIVSVFMGLVSIRYISSFFAALSWVCFFVFLVQILFLAGALGKAIAPFLGMALSAGVYIYLQRTYRNRRPMVWWEVVQVVEVLAVFTFYASGNYYVVRELSGSVIDSASGEIPLYFFFYTYTLAVPLALISWGLRKKNRILLQSGLITFVLGIATIRYYHSFIPAETALTGG